MKVSIHQPDYIPYLGFFYKMYKSDLFIYLD
ncbi:WbqC family protein, partial [Parabacteroides distasonis]